MPQDIALDRQFLNHVQKYNLAMRANDKLPGTVAEWEANKKTLRSNLLKSWGGFPNEPCNLEPRVMGTLKRDGYRVEKLVIQTRPGVLMTANAYVPDGNGKRASVLSVHGHWRQAKSEKVVQSRCIGLAKLGFFVLMVDAFGAGERGINPALGEYHGEMVAATLFPTGSPLSGLQVYENMRAVDYMLTRPEVDPDRIGITGCSGGGNQTMYAGAFDERHKAVVPVCSVGTYQAYLGAACCMCEVVPNAMSYTEEWGVLSLVAPRALMLINASRDSFQFSIGEAKKSLTKAQHVFDLYGKKENTRHSVFESKHDYNQPMRESMYGWMTKHLKDEGDGSPISEPKFETEEAEALRCFPGDSRPASFVTLPQFAAAESRRILAKRPTPKHVEQWESEETLMRESLPRVLGGMPRTKVVEGLTEVSKQIESITFESEPGITIRASRHPGQGKSRGQVVLLDLENARQAINSPLAKEFLRNGHDVITVDLRSTGATSNKGDKIARAPDHNSAEWSMWIGRPLLGQWVFDVRQLLTVLEKNNSDKQTTTVVGIGSASVVALAAAALDSRIKKVASVNGLATYVSPVPYEKQRLGIIVPGILRSVGDIPQIASLVAPRRLVIAEGVSGEGKPLNAKQLESNYSWTQSVYRLISKKKELSIVAKADAAAIVQLLDT
jgi:cephalosporin-C deacetylase-like acetyl esterase